MTNVYWDKRENENFKDDQVLQMATSKSYHSESNNG